MKIDNIKMMRSKSLKYLGFYIGKQLQFEQHIKQTK